MELFTTVVDWFAGSVSVPTPFRVEGGESGDEFGGRLA